MTYFRSLSQTYKQSWSKQPEVTNTWLELQVTATVSERQRLPNYLLLYSHHVPLPKDNGWDSLCSLQTDLPFLLTLLPYNADQVYWHLIRLGCKTIQADSTV